MNILMIFKQVLFDDFDSMLLSSLELLVFNFFYLNAKDKMFHSIPKIMKVKLFITFFK